MTDQQFEAALKFRGMTLTTSGGCEFVELGVLGHPRSIALVTAHTNKRDEQLTYLLECRDRHWEECIVWRSLPSGEDR
jgi:hypothetical protein